MRADTDRHMARGRAHPFRQGMRYLPGGQSQHRRPLLRRARSYDELSTEGIIHNKRGIGYFVSPGARNVIRDKQREGFISGDLKEVFRKMEILGISIEDITSLYRKYITKDNN